MEDCEIKEQNIELKPHLFKLYLKMIGFKLLYVVNEAGNSDLDISPQKSRPLYVYQKWIS